MREAHDRLHDLSSLAFKAAYATVSTLPGDAIRAVARSALRIAELQLCRLGQLPALDVTLTLSRALARPLSDEKAAQLGAACLCVYSGADLLDNVVDDEVDDTMKGVPSGALVTTAAALLACCAPDALNRIGLPERRALIACRRLSEGLAEMAAGQVDDVRSEASDVTGVLAAVERKSGGEMALFAGLVPLVAGNTRSQMSFEGFGRAFGVAGQLSSDCHDLWHRRPSHDLRAGSLTLPIAFGLASDRRLQIQELLLAARGDGDVHERVASALAECGALTYVALVVERYIKTGLRALALLPLEQHDRDALALQLRSLSLIPR